MLKSIKNIIVPLFIFFSMREMVIDALELRKWALMVIVVLIGWVQEGKPYKFLVMCAKDIGIQLLALIIDRLMMIGSKQSEDVVTDDKMQRD